MRSSKKFQRLGFSCRMADGSYCLFVLLSLSCLWLRWHELFQGFCLFTDKAVIMHKEFRL